MLYHLEAPILALVEAPILAHPEAPILAFLLVPMSAYLDATIWPISRHQLAPH